MPNDQNHRWLSVRLQLQLITNIRGLITSRYWHLKSYAKTQQQQLQYLSCVHYPRHWCLYVHTQIHTNS